MLDRERLNLALGYDLPQAIQESDSNELGVIQRTLARMLFRIVGRSAAFTTSMEDGQHYLVSFEAEPIDEDELPF